MFKRILTNNNKMNLESRVQELESEIMSLHNRNVVLEKLIETLETTLIQLVQQTKCTCTHQTTHHHSNEITRVV